LPGLALMASLPLTAPVWTMIITMILAGSGIGMCLIGSITSAQNALRTQDIGAGTGALLVLRSIGGASGSTLAGAIMGSGLTAIHHGAGAAASSVTSSLEQSATAIVDLTGAGAHLGSSFAMIYATAALIAPVAFAVTLWMRNTSLRESQHVFRVSE